jgi:spermidine synthase
MVPLLGMSSDTHFASSIFSLVLCSYPSGQIGFIIATKGRATCKKPVRKPVDEAVLRYYTPELHEAAFVLPAFCKRQIEGEKK